MSMSGREAADALASVRETKLRAGRTRRWTWSYHLAFGALMGGLVAVQAAPLAWRMLGLVAFAVGVGLLYRWGRATSGRWVNGFRAGRTRWVAIGMAGLILAIMLGTVHLAFSRGVPVAPLYGGLLVFAVAALGDRLWVAAYDADLRDGR